MCMVHVWWSITEVFRLPSPPLPSLPSTLLSSPPLPAACTVSHWGPLTSPHGRHLFPSPPLSSPPPPLSFPPLSSPPLPSPPLPYLPFPPLPTTPLASPLLPSLPFPPLPSPHLPIPHLPSPPLPSLLSPPLYSPPLCSTLLPLLPLPSPPLPSPPSRLHAVTPCVYITTWPSSLPLPTPLPPTWPHDRKKYDITVNYFPYTCEVDTRYNLLPPHGHDEAMEAGGRESEPRPGILSSWGSSKLQAICAFPLWGSQSR